jgi:hypothetical protein
MMSLPPHPPQDLQQCDKLDALNHGTRNMRGGGGGQGTFFPLSTPISQLVPAVPPASPEYLFKATRKGTVSRNISLYL